MTWGPIVPSPSRGESRPEQNDLHPARAASDGGKDLAETTQNGWSRYRDSEHILTSVCLGCSRKKPTDAGIHSAT